MKTITAFIFSILFTANPTWAASSCAQLKAELQAMQKAQSQVMASLVNNHESFATSMEEYSSMVKESQGEASTKAVSGKMNDSAQAFRTRGIQGKKMATKLQGATDDLLARVASCLK